MNDEAGREILVIAHCLMNVISRLQGIRGPPMLDLKGKNVIQLPCPETIYLGLDRREITRDQLEHPHYRRFCRELFEPFADMIEQFYDKGLKIRILGVPKSPSCAADVTTIGGKGGKVTDFKHEHIPGKGVFFEEIEAELMRRNVLYSMEDS
ncbi:MAG: hypothetical protein K8R64_05760 [Methanosarcinaceae archaeon]|nr:hypothetical protein [Methanosarcinaceae archaeon]